MSDRIGNAAVACTAALKDMARNFFCSLFSCEVLSCGLNVCLAGFRSFQGLGMRALVALVLLAIGTLPLSAQGNLSRNRYDSNSTGNPYGAGNPYDPNSINNPYGRYGSEYSPDSVNNPYATNAPKLYDSDGNYRGRLSANPYDPDSTSNPYGRYGSKYSPDSINNPYGAGNPYSPNSPTNALGKASLSKGMMIKLPE